MVRYLITLARLPRQKDRTPAPWGYEPRVYDALVLLICSDLLVGMLHLTDKEANRKSDNHKKGREYSISTDTLKG